jgi:hypothetical protein
MYSAIAKTPAPPGPPAPPPAKKAKRKASDSRPPPIDYANLSHNDLILALQEREKPAFDWAHNPLPSAWTSSVPPTTSNPKKPAARQQPPKKSPKTISLPAAQRRFYATRTTAAPFEDAATFAASLPLTLGRALDAIHANVDKAFTVTINPNGTVTVLAAPSAPAVDYVNFFQLLTNTLNTTLPVNDNPFTSFNLAPTTADYAIHNLPVHVLPTTPGDLLNTMRDAIGYATGATINAARFLKPNPADRTKATTSVVISITPDQAMLLKDSIRLFSRSRKCEKMFSASLITQCRNCCKFGHPAQLCKETSPTCPICSASHTRDAHRCGNQGCIKGGNDKATPGCCDTIPLKCPNCNDQHTASFPGCPVKADAIAALRIRTNRATSINAPPLLPPASEHGEEDAVITDA